MRRLDFCGVGYRLLSGVLLGALIAGCASTTPPDAFHAPATPISGSAAAVLKRTYQDAITVSGRLALRYELRGQPEAVDGKFSWVQSSNMTHITLQTPFGQTVATIDVTPDRSILLQSGQPPRSETSVDALIAGTLGWPLPLAGLRDWLQGFAVNAQGTPYVATAAAVGDAAYVKTADGWLIHYPVWDDSTDTAASVAARPKRIDLQRTTSQAGNVQLHIVIDQWQPR